MAFSFYLEDSKRSAKFAKSVKKFIDNIRPL